jgi:uncharacterized protein
MAHGVCHVEIPTADLPGARDFLAGLFGWTFTEAFPGYWLFTTGDGPGGGLNKVDTPPPEGGIVLYLHVDAVGATLARATGLGGEMRQGVTEIGGGYGHFALVKIPGGAVLGLWSRLP